VRRWHYVALPAALAAMLSPEAVRAALATTAGALLEAAPFALSSVALAKLVRHRSADAYLGCGCGTGPSARSLPAAFATVVTFGAAVAAARFLAATIVARALPRPGCSRHCEPPKSLLDRLQAVLPAAALAGAVSQFEGLVDVAHLAPALQAAAGAALAFVAAPCALGAVAVAGSLHARAPLAATGFLCVAGIVDVRALRPRARAAVPAHDAAAYAAMALALSTVAWLRGAALVHPALSPLLACSALGCVILTIAHRGERTAQSLGVPAILLAAAFVAAPPPEYRATETTLTDLFAGERVSFTGRVAVDGGATALVRYAIVCCRADASPVVLRLARRVRYPPGTWLRAAGAIAIRDGVPQLLVRSVEAIAPPSDPFIYR